LRRQLFQDRQTLLELAYERESSLAVDAYWRLYRETKETAVMSSFGGPRRVQTRSSAARFFGYVEGRYDRVVIPNWWQETFIIGDKVTGAPEYKASDVGISLPLGVTATRTDEGIRLLVDDAALDVGGKAFQMIKEAGGSTWSVLAERSRTVVACHDHRVAQKYRLFCIESESKRVKWSADVWGLGVENLGGISGSWWHSVELQAAGGRLYVFGAGSGGCYIEAFRMSDGECQLRFATNEWFANEAQPKRN
jgi:hypothetical protein